MPDRLPVPPPENRALTETIAVMREHLINALVDYRDNERLVRWYAKGLRLLDPLEDWAQTDTLYWDEMRSQMAE